MKKHIHAVDYENTDWGFEYLLAYAGGSVQKTLYCVVSPFRGHMHFEVLNRLKNKKYEFKYLKCAIRKYNEI